MRRTCPTCDEPVQEGDADCASCGSRLVHTMPFAAPTAPITGSKDRAAPKDHPKDPPAIGAHTVLTPTPSNGRQAETGTFVVGQSILGRYRIEGRLGKGGMGTVYRATDETLQQPVALKFLSAKEDGDAVDVLTLRNEVRLARQVSHPNVCRVHDIGEYDGRPFISMEYIDGEDLSTLLKRVGRLTGDKANQISRQLCAGLFAAHQKGVLHRDLKPANVMIDGEGDVRIADFGISTGAGVADDPDRLVGTPAYMAPEIFVGKGTSVQSDLYALGLILYELYTGIQLNRSNSLTELLKNHEAPAPRPSQSAPGIDPSVEQTILACLNRDPAARPASALAVLAGLPGGDPLAEALRAGTTPSPDLIASAGTCERTAPTTIAAALVLFGLALAFLLQVDGGIKLERRIPLPNSPSVLRDRARTHLERLGIPTDGAATASGFTTDIGVRSEAASADADFTTWKAELEGMRPPWMEFWYSQAEEAGGLIATNLRGRVEWDDPAAAKPGMLQLKLDPEGRLRELLAHPSEHALALSAKEQDKVAGPPDWAALFETLGLDLTLFHEAEPASVPMVFADQLAAWDRELPEPPYYVRVEAAAWRGKIVSAKVIEQRDELRNQLLSSPPRQGATWESIAQLALIAGALVLMTMSLRRGRGDVRGSVRVGAIIFALVVAFTMLTGDSTGSWVGVANLFLKGMTHGIAVGTMLGVFYFAFEPHARHIWPQILIGWSRFVRGRVFDPIVGRDVLVGLALGGVGCVLRCLHVLIPRWIDGTESAPQLFHPSSLLLLEGVGPAFGVFLEIVVDLSREAFKVFLSMVLLRLVLKSRVAATVAAAVVWGMAWHESVPEACSPTAVAISWTLALATGAIYTIALVRFGFLAVVIGFVEFGLLATFPLNLDLAHWTSSVSLLGLGISAALLLFGLSQTLLPELRAARVE